MCPDYTDCKNTYAICPRLSAYENDICLKCANNIDIIEKTYLSTRKYHICQRDHKERTGIMWCIYFCGNKPFVL